MTTLLENMTVTQVVKKLSAFNTTKLSRPFRLCD